MKKKKKKKKLKKRNPIAEIMGYTTTPKTFIDRKKERLRNLCRERMVETW